MPDTSKAPSWKARRQQGQAPAQGSVSAGASSSGNRRAVKRPDRLLSLALAHCCSCSPGAPSQVHPADLACCLRPEVPPTRGIVKAERESQRVDGEVVQVHAALSRHLLEGGDQRLGGCRQRGGSGTVQSARASRLAPGQGAESKQSTAPLPDARGAHPPRPGAGWPPRRAPCQPCQTGAAGRWWIGWRQTAQRPAPLPRQRPGACGGGGVGRAPWAGGDRRRVPHVEMAQSSCKRQMRPSLAP